MRRYSSGKSPNLTWQMEANLGQNFEDFVAKIIMAQLRQLHPQVQVFQTRRVADGGKDVIVSTKINTVNILGQSFTSFNGKGIQICFECKSTDNSILRYDKISSSSSRMQFQDTEKYDYYVLVTNSEILPQTYWYLTKSLERSNISFRLIDGYLLGTYLLSLEDQKLQHALNNPYSLSDHADFYYEYQVDTVVSQLTNRYDLYMLFRNYSNNEKHCVLQLRTDVDWNTSEDNISFVIAPSGATVKKVTVEQKHFDGIPELLFHIQINGTESVVMINGINGTQIFEPPFFGESRIQIVNDLEERLKSTMSPSIVCFWGDAGIGKTRLVQELFSRLQGTLFDLYECKLQQGHTPQKEIERFLLEHGYIQEGQYVDFVSMTENCRTPFGNQAVIFLDDFHNADDSFLCEIQRLKSNLSSITLLISGRTDFTIGNINYLSFVQWANENLPESCFNVEPLTDDEAKNLIRVLIDGIPPYALDRLFNLSAKNPLFIVQYVEYLLDCSLVKIQNRNTVGIIDINKFHVKRFMPTQIADIYYQRLSHLQKEKDGETCLNLLYKIALCNGKMNPALFNMFFEDSSDQLNELMRRRLLKYEENETIAFVHESLFLYVSEQLKGKKAIRTFLAKEIVSIPNIDHVLGMFQTGRLYLYSKDYKKAREYLHTIETWLIAVDNISNVNVNLNYYKYLEDMFELLRHVRKNLPLAKKALLMRVYITLHHFAPIKAVDECDIVLKKLKQYKMVDDRPFCLSIMELKAHALMNAGLYPDGEILLKEIQADWLCNKEILSDETLFDLYDRLAAVYRAFNLIDLSKTYNTLSITLADKLDDNRLRALAYRTKFKITLYPNMDLSSESLRKSIEATALMPSKRIETDNSLDVCALEILSNSTVHQDKLILKLNSMLQDIEANNLHRAQIHCFFLLAICNLLKSEEKATLLAKEYVDRAINLSTSYGIVGYLWRLYNLQAIIGIRMGFDSQHIYKIFFTVFDILKKQGLLYIGNRDACEGNILALSNIGYYLQERKFESQFYQTMSLVTFAGQEYSAYPNQNLSDNPVNTFLVQQYAKARKREILFAQNTPSNLLWDTQTRYLLIL